MQDKAFSDPLVQDALAGRATAVLATINPDGSPLATPMWYVCDTHGFIMLSVDALQKVRNLRRDPRVSVTVESEAPGVKCVIVQGSVRFVDGATERAELGAAFIAKYGPDIEKRWSGCAVPQDRVLFRIDPARVKLWG